MIAGIQAASETFQRQAKEPLLIIIARGEEPTLVNTCQIP